MSAFYPLLSNVVDFLNKIENNCHCHKKWQTLPIFAICLYRFGLFYDDFEAMGRPFLEHFGGKKYSTYIHIKRIIPLHHVISLRFYVCAGCKTYLASKKQVWSISNFMSLHLINLLDCFDNFQRRNRTSKVHLIIEWCRIFLGLSIPICGECGL